MLVTKKEFAEMSGMSASQITRLSKTDVLSRAIKGTGRDARIDTKHKIAVEFLKAKGVDGENKALNNQSLSKKDIPEDITELADIPLREIIYKYGQKQEFLDWLRALKEIELIDDRRIKTAKLKGELISRSLVERAFIVPVDSMCKQLLSDASKTISRRLKAMIEADKFDDVELEKYVSTTIGTFIRPTKSKIQRTLAALDVEVSE